jgi:hypothetical protein
MAKVFQKSHFKQQDIARSPQISIMPMVQIIMDGWNSRNSILPGQK